MSEILHLNLHREFFAAIANKQKRIEYRRQSRHRRKRLEERKYDAILFRNGYAKDAPEMLATTMRLSAKSSSSTMVRSNATPVTA